ncbi:MAG: tail fiber domain-containing protein [Bacteroidota bacterium]
MLFACRKVLSPRVSSDSKLKHDVQPMQKDALAIINELRPVSYYYNHDKEKSKRAYGFIAQEVEAVLPELILYPEEGAENAHLMLNYDDFTPFAIKGIQDVHQKVIESEQEMALLRAEIEALKQLLRQLHADIPLETEVTSKEVTDQSYLLQSQPNPSNGLTMIKCFVAPTTQEAILQVANTNGQIVRSIHIQDRGHISLPLDMQDLRNGTYFYTLITDGLVVASQQLLLVK